MTEDSSQSRTEKFASWKAKAGKKMRIGGQKAKETAGVAAKYAGKAIEENAVVIPVTPAVMEAGAGLTKGFNAFDEKMTSVGGAINRGFDRVEQAGSYVGTQTGKGFDSLRKTFGLKPIGARIAERSSALANNVLREKVAGVKREVGAKADTVVSTFYKDRIRPHLDLESKDKKEDEETSPSRISQLIERASAKLAKKEKEVDPRVEAAGDILEGSKLVELMTPGLEAAVAFDQMDSTAGFKASEKILRGADTGEEFKEKLSQIKAMEAKVLEARGETPNVSLDYERRETEKSEERQREAVQLGLDVMDLLSGGVDELTMSDVNSARAKAISLVRKNRGVIAPLTNIARSLEKRFPKKVKEIRAALLDLVTPLSENNDVSEAIYAKVDVTKIMTESSGDLYKSLIKGNPFFSSLTVDQRDSIMLDLGATRVAHGNQVENRYDFEEGSVYDNASQAFVDYARVSAAFEAMQEHVKDHPEVAGQLVVMAERVVQAKAALKLASNKIKAEITVRSRKVLHEKEVVGLEAKHTGQELADKKARKEYYARILDRFAKRIDDESDMVKKVKKYMAIGGVVAIGALAAIDTYPLLVAQIKSVGAEMAVQGPGILEALKEQYDLAMAAIKRTADAIGNNYAPTIKGGVTVIKGLAGLQLLGFLRGKIGKGVAGRSEKLKERTAEDNAAVLAGLQESLAGATEGTPLYEFFQKSIKDLS